MRIEFTEDEMVVMVMQEAETRSECLEKLDELIPELSGDPVMLEFAQDARDKLVQITDAEYKKLNFSDYDVRVIDLYVDEEGEVYGPAYDENDYDPEDYFDHGSEWLPDPDSIAGSVYGDI